MMERRVEGMGGAAMLRAFSHDMRTPLENVIALAQMSLRRLGEGKPDSGETVETYLRRILAAARDMEMMTDDLLSGDTPVRRERFDARELAESLGEAIGAKAAVREQTLKIDVSALGEEALIGDRAALLRILTNLLSNAIKYTPPGGRISLTARIAQRTADGVLAEFTVEDNGMGMDEVFLARMYEPMARSPQAIDQQIPGHGLGLAIVRRLTQRMNGTIRAESAPGQGTKMTLRVPLDLPRDAGTLSARRFLLAEDNELSAQIARQLLAMQGAHVSCAADGAQVVQLFLSSPAGTFDAILMDMRMPGMDGCAAAQAIRSSAHADAIRIPILALTAGGDGQDEYEARAAGMDACLKKPLDTAMLSAAMNKRCR